MASLGTNLCMRFAAAAKANKGASHIACMLHVKAMNHTCKFNIGRMTVQDRSDKIQSFSKFQAELRAQQRQGKSGHKHKHDKRDKRHRADKPTTPKATPVATPGQADNVQASLAHCAFSSPRVISCVKFAVNTMLSLTAHIASVELS